MQSLVNSHCKDMCRYNHGLATLALNGVAFFLFHDFIVYCKPLSVQGGAGIS